MAEEYNHQKIEQNWRDKWFENNLYAAEDFSDKEKKYILAELPYPSGKYLHAGHMFRYTVPEIYSRFLRMQGYNVLFPMGWDCFGLPAETFAIKEGTTPQKAISQAKVDYKNAMQLMGYGIDWAREVSTSDPDYYTWTQWMFLKLYDAGLAVQKEMPVWWCEELGVLADEEIITLEDGTKVSERDKHPVQKKLFKQWVLNIPAYAEKLLAGLEDVDYSDSVKLGQQNWIGKKEGVEIDYPVVDSEEIITCFTTRPDTNFGATFIVLAPEHPFAQQIDKPEVQAYIKSATEKSDLERLQEGMTKTGVFTGFYAKNRLNNQELPIWISDFVLGHYGTGAVVGVPAHDDRDSAFADTFDLPKISVYEDNKVINSDFLNGLTEPDAIVKITSYLTEKGWGRNSITYKIREQIFSRQRYWGEPIPLSYDENKNIIPLAVDELPLELPVMEDFLPSDDGTSPLARNAEWNTYQHNNETLHRETDTMPTWAGSNWYYIRYLDPKNTDEFCSKELMQYWLPVDKYFGDAGHTTAHLIYTRFWVRALHDAGYIPEAEPIMWRMSGGILLGADMKKMSKSRPEYTIDPETVLAQYGADALRVCFAFLGPYDETFPWNPRSLQACYKLTKTIYELKNRVADTTNSKLTIEITKTIGAMTPMLEQLKMNTAVSEIMKLTNILKKTKEIPQDIWKDFILLVAPFMPFLAEELWQEINKTEWSTQNSVHLQPWPSFNPDLLANEKIVIPIQINGKRRAELNVDQGLSEAKIKELALAEPNVQAHVGDQEVKKFVYVQDKIINLVL